MSRRASRDYRALAGPIGMVSTGIGVAALICSVAGYIIDAFLPTSSVRGGSLTMMLCAALPLLAGVALLWQDKDKKANKGLGTPRVTRRVATLAVALIWVASGVWGAIPFVVGAGMSPVDAFFESVSGLTTTGATVITDIEGTLSHPLLLWRSLLQWLGGMGIVVLFVAVFPGVGIGGRHLIRGEVPGTRTEDLKPRIAETSFALWRLYVVFTVIEFLVLMVLGMHPFEAVCHALTTMSTGGFSTRDASIGAFQSPAIEIAVSLFMYIGTVNYGLYFFAIRRRSLRGFWSSPELRFYLLIVAISVIATTIGIRHLHNDDWYTAWRNAFFMVATTISSTGYGVDDYMAYPTPVLFLFLILMFVGGCSGSTAGGLKIERAVLIGKVTWNQIKKFYRPNLVQVVRMGSAVPNGVLLDVAAVIAVYAACMAIGILVLTGADNTSVPTAFGAMLTSLSNMGPAPFYDGADNFASYTAISKLYAAVAMLLGRLEFFTLLALIVPAFWRR